MKKRPPLLACALLLLLPCATASAQQKEGEFAVTFGFNGRDQARHPEAGRARIATPVNFRLQLTDKYKLLVGVDHDSFLAKKQADGQWSKGTGNVALLIRPEFFTQEAESWKPTVRLAYSITLPTANVAKGLGTGRVDHKILGTIVRRVREDDTNKRNQIGIDLGMSFQGRQGQSGFKKVGLLNLFYERKLDAAAKKYVYHGEVDMLSRADTSPSQIFTTNYLKVTINQRVSVKFGFVAGFTPTYGKAGGYASIELTGPKLW